MSIPGPPDTAGEPPDRPRRSDRRGGPLLAVVSGRRRDRRLRVPRGRARANADRDREQMLALAGRTVHRFTADQVRNDPETTIHRLGALIKLARAG